MKMAHSMQGIYSPLPQSLSDSDSEKEISMEPICTSYNSKNTNNFDDSYRQNGHSIGLDEDIVKIKRGASKMSTPRKITFACSIVLCILPVIIFMWVLPCSELHTCPIKISNWEYQQEGIELKGPINIVSGAYKTNYNLAVLYKGSINSPKNLQHGVISLMGLTGNMAWDFEQDVEPQQMDCSIIDTNGDGSLDCLVVDVKGLKAIETVSGQTLWHAHSSEEIKRVRNLTFPIAISDLDNDGIVELLCVFETVNFLVISGRTGRALGNMGVPHCGVIHEIYKPEKNANAFTYRCGNTTGVPDIFKIRFFELEQSIKNPAYEMIIEPVAYQGNYDIFSVGNRKLSVKNGPNCPKCQGVLTLYGEYDQIFKSWTYNNAYIMNPQPFSFEASNTKKAKLRGHLNGFIVKIWQWSEHYRKLRPTQRVNKRSLMYSGANETFFSINVNESVIFITFNDSDVQVINASKKEIIQICKEHAADCQPSVENQKDSLLVEDLEHDSSRELVSFYSSYVKKGDDWHLVSYVKLLRLEEELPMIYGSK